MKLFLVLVVILVGLAIVTASCSTLAGFVTSSHVDWSFVQTVGGMKVGNPQPISKGSWSIPIECDVSGLTTVTTKPTTLNSSLVVKNVKCMTKQDRILIWVVTCVVTERYKESHWTNNITLKGMDKGKYRVQYLNSDGSLVDIRLIELRE